jgi:hypothetical protein
MLVCFWIWYPHFATQYIYVFRVIVTVHRFIARSPWGRKWRFIYDMSDSCKKKNTVVRLWPKETEAVCTVSIKDVVAVVQQCLKQNNYLESRYFFFPMPPHVAYGLRGLPSWLWPNCNRLLSLGRPWGVVTLSRWGGWCYMNMKYQEGP